MASSDDEGEIVPNNASDYQFFSATDESISFAELPVEWNKDRTKPQQIFLDGKTDNGLRKIYKEVVAWKFDLSRTKPEVSVLSTDGDWIRLLKPRNAYQDIIRTIQITLHLLHFVKWNPQKSHKALWDHLDKTFRILEKRPCEDDLVDHLPLINEAIKRDETLENSKLLGSVLEEKPWNRQKFNEDLKPPFIVDEIEDPESDEIDENGDDEDDCFDSVCAICDNGGNIYICDGKCMRAFHATVEDGEESNCDSLGFTEEELEAVKNVPFYCKNCQYKQHQCFACGELGSSDESSGVEVFCCVNGACGHFYHPYCVAKLLHPGNDAAAEEHGQRIAAGEQFACPAHRCHVCKELEVRSEKELQFAVCRRCPRAYHRKCLPREIAFEENVDEERGIIQRAWEGLIPNRILIYCLYHEIDPDIATPVRNHIKFPGPQGKKMKKLLLESSKTKDPYTERGLALENSLGKKISAKPPKGVDKVFSSSKQGDLSRKRVEKLLVQGYSKKQKLATDRNSLGKSNESTTNEGETSLGDRLYAFYRSDSEILSGKSDITQKVKPAEHETTQKIKTTTKSISNTVSLDADSRKRILTLMREASSSVTLDKVKERHRSPLVHTQYSKYSLDNITLGKVEGAVQALRAALKKLDEGGTVQDAKAVFGNDLLAQVERWKDKLKVYLAPFLYGMRYTSFGRHFTKIDKLKEVVDVLHWYVQEGDMLVDFCCGSNDFSCLMKKKLDEMGKRCSFKNYDFLQAKNDFNFERRDWMGVRADELPDGSQLIMGLNPPFGVKAFHANKFINKALEFKPKLLILIVPRETERLDEKASPYDLIWENDQMFLGKSFYLPGSVDSNDQQMEDWNKTAPVLYLWSNPGWTSKHKGIAEQHGHLSGAQKKVEESQREMHVPNSSQECQNLAKILVSTGEDTNPDKPENQEEEKEEGVSTSRQESSAHDSRGAEGDKNGPHENNNHSEADSKKFGGKRKWKRQSNNKFLGNKSSGKHSMSPKHRPTASRVHSERDDYQRNLHTNHQPHSQARYNGSQAVDDLVRKYSLNGDEPMTSRGAYAPSPMNPDYDRWRGSSEGRANSLAHRSYMGPMDEEYDVNMNGRMVEPPHSWSQTSIRPSYAPAGFPSPYGQLNPGVNTGYGGMNAPSAMQRYASRLDELDPRMTNMGPGPPPVPDYHPRPSRPALHLGSLGFAPGPHHPYSQHNSSGWLNE